MTETRRQHYKPLKTDINGQKRTETDRNRRKQTELDENIEN